MKTSSLRVRVTVATVLVLALSLAGFAVAVTLDYRGGLERDLRNRLAGGGLALSRTPNNEIKQLVSSLALEGINVSFSPARPLVGGSSKPGRQSAPAAAGLAKPESVHTHGNLLVLEIPVSGAQGQGPAAGTSRQDGGHTASPGGKRAIANLHATAEGVVASLVRRGKIDAHQAEVIDGQVDAGSVDARELVSHGIVSERQMGAVTQAIDAVKRSGQPESGSTILATLTASQSSVDTPVHQLIVAEVVAGLAAVTLATLLLLWGLRTALSPLAHVGRVAAQIAGGDRGQRLNPERPNTELGRMAASFDGMVSALDASVEQSHRSEATMRRFLADASHELRTPIAALHATVETLLREQPPRPERDALEAQLARESARLGALVDDLLSLARLEGNDSLRREEADLVDIAEEVAAETRARARGVLIDVSHTGEATVTGDADALARALRNLLDNAVSATGGVGGLRVQVKRSDAEVVLRVSDDGPGVSPNQRERIFEDFVRLDGDGRPGAGLGLAIVRRIAEQHHGVVVCEDTDRGACFALRIPAAPRFPVVAAK
jgi:two-component system, OmpR family, sensor kinase